ncbi:hypothetical protein [Xanthomonas maliensis]|uniref:hypothetical protein n=1 Tax=Xanthomonas maliensis TaxID=1321368 RepID=UPI0003A3BB20|nr:hypothetical protein [Xanthomonas maliensis]KAB7765524.1 hypothetical protein CKY51_15495 [Xanthomonas maliensis]
MSPRAALGLIAGFAVIDGATSVVPGWNGSGLDLLRLAVMMVLLFVWLGADSRQLGYRRPAWMNIGIVALAIVFLPLYLYRSRPPGRRLRAFGGLALAVLGYTALAIAASLIADLVLSPRLVTA